MVIDIDGHYGRLVQQNIQIASLIQSQIIHVIKRPISRLSFFRLVFFKQCLIYALVFFGFDLVLR
jgi:hypothetical protein